MTRQSEKAGRSTVYAPNGIVATSQPLASSTALGVLMDGGNAVDAAVAAAAVLSVVEPHMTGIGGDVFALVWPPEDRELIGLDASGLSGSLMTPEALEATGSVPGSGPASVTVPGALSGWAALLDRFGSRSLAELLEPATGFAENGFPVSPIVAGQWAKQTPKLKADPGAAQTFLVGGGAPEAGDWVTNPGLAENFRLIARDGPGALYGGELGRRISEHLLAEGGFVTLDDLATHGVRWVRPISVEFRGYSVWQIPPAGQGVAALQMLKLLEPYDLASMGHNSAEYLHHLIEAKKLAFADLGRYVADADHMDVTVDELLDPDYLVGRRALLNSERTSEFAEPGSWVTESETIYLTVADRYGMMVSFINSVAGYFGSGVVAPGTGFVLQNRGAGFTLEKDHPNRVGPRKRPLHTIIPAFITKGGEPWMSYGLMGGAIQPQGHTQFILNLLEFGMDVQDAIDANRFRHMTGFNVAIEGVSEDVRDELRAMGHRVVEGLNVTFGGAQAILRLPRGWAAGSDPRKDGSAIGY